ncbi:MAG: class I SAM-dependent methyltransferase, partial [Chloroflexota bacterium]|nr:class I SAM-dependent methyltransferase [Chloroflexota bacterium]
MSEPTSGSAANRWTAYLQEWAIPKNILDAAPESPWGFPVEQFARRADAALGRPRTASDERALEALPRDGSVLDVGCGAGAASLPLAPEAGRLIGVDLSAELLDAFRQRVLAAGKEVRTVQGAWPDVAEQTPKADVVICHHVFYNVPGLAAFARELTSHARRRVVVELTASHPMSR